MDLSVSHTFLTIDDYDKSLAFYRDVLGFEVRVDVTMDDYRWLTVGLPSQPDLEIGLGAARHHGMASDVDKKLLDELMAKGVLNALILRTDDCDAAFEQVRASGAEVLQEPTDQAYGVRDCAFRDPSGNMIRFSQPLG